jgi:chemotaxis protein MotC
MVALGCSTIQAHACDLVGSVWELIESQDRAVAGDAPRQAKIMPRIDGCVSSLSTEDWKQQRNYRAAVIYVLAGGGSTRFRRLLQDHIIEEKDPPLLTASLAFADRDRENAIKLMSPIDVRIYTSILAGHLALVRGGLLIGVDNKEAAKSLAYARLMMPGSQVEEAALRREIAITDPRTETERYILLARRYQFNYPRSPFATKYWQNLTSTLSKMDLAMEGGRAAEFEELFKAAPASFGFEFHATLARMSIQMSRPEILKAQTQAAEGFAESAQAKERVKLYQAALHVMVGDLVASDSDLKNIDASALNKEEVMILKTLRSVGARLEVGDEPQPAQAATSAPDRDPDMPLFQSLERSLDDSGKLLERAGR